MNIIHLEVDDNFYLERLLFCSDVASRPLHSKNSDSPQLLSAKTIKFRKTSVSLGITLCSTLKINRRFGGTCLHIHGRRISQAKNSSSFTLASSLAYSSILRMESICSSETSVCFRRSTLHYLVEERILYGNETSVPKRSGIS
jgi:hypothetical protein